MSKDDTSGSIKVSSLAKSSNVKRDEQKKRSSTTSGITAAQIKLTINNMEQIKAKSATLSRKQANQIMSEKKAAAAAAATLSTLNQRSVSKYKHQIAYKKSLILSLFKSKWQILQDRMQSNVNYSKAPKCLRYLNGKNNDSEGGCTTAVSINHVAKSSENLRLLVHLYWTCICLLESDFEHEFVLAIEIIEQIMSKVDLATGVAFNGQLLIHKNEFRTNLELFSFRINWPNFPGLQNLLMKGCTSPSTSTVDATQRLLVKLIPHCSKLNFIDPYGMSYYGMWGLSMNLIALLPTMILNYDKPSELCIKAAESYCKIIRDQVKLLEEQKRPQHEQQQQQSQQQQQTSPNHYNLKSSKIENLKNLGMVCFYFYSKEKIQKKPRMINIF